MKLISSVPIFKDRVELEKISISNRSLKFFTLSSIYQANRALLGKTKINETVSEDEYKLAIEFWTFLSEIIPEWKLLILHKVTADELRRDYIHAHGVALHAMGLAGHSLLEKHPRDWKKYLKSAESIDWSRTNSKTWEGRATIGGVVSKARTNLILTANYLKNILDLPLTAEEQKLEKLVRSKLKVEREIIHAG
jgi:DNA sulfur modification protein DndB